MTLIGFQRIQIHRGFQGISTHLGFQGVSTQLGFQGDFNHKDLATSLLTVTITSSVGVVVSDNMMYSHTRDRGGRCSAVVSAAAARSTGPEFDSRSPPIFHLLKQLRKTKSPVWRILG